MGAWPLGSVATRKRKLRLRRRATNTSTIKSENPFTTFGRSPKPSAEFTIPKTLTTRFTRSRLSRW
jgi:hypothetical protein